MHPPIFGAVFFLAEALEQKWCANAAVTEWSTQPFYSSRPVASGFWYVCEYDVASKPLAKHFTTSAIVIGLWLLFMCLQLKKKLNLPFIVIKVMQDVITEILVLLLLFLNDRNEL